MSGRCPQRGHLHSRIPLHGTLRYQETCQVSESQGDEQGQHRRHSGMRVVRPRVCRGSASIQFHPPAHSECCKERSWISLSICFFRKHAKILFFFFLGNTPKFSGNSPKFSNSSCLLLEYPGNPIRTSIHDKLSGSMKPTTHLDHIVHFESTPGTD